VKTILLVPWIVFNQPPSSYQAEFDTLAAYIAAKNGLFNEAARLKAAQIVEIGVVADAHCASKHDKGLIYRIRFRLPKDHPDAHDENGRPQVTKYSAIWDVELTRFNPEER
jgi:hypothetical protein